MRHQFLPALAIALAVASGLSAQDGPAPPADFTFKRIAPPMAGTTGPRITVQIDPEEQARLLAIAPRPPRPVGPAEDQAAPRQPQTSGHEWFWQVVPPEIDAGAGRFVAALGALDNAPDGVSRGPRLQHMQDLATRHGADILRHTVGTNVSPALVLAVIAVESAGRTEAVSHAGAVGLMQLIPATAERFGVSDSTDATQNIAGGVAYLDWLMREFDRDVVLALAGYNAGENAVKSNGGVPPYAETRAYVPKVLAAWTVARGLCLTPPELASDPCAFRLASAGG